MDEHNELLIIYLKKWFCRVDCIDRFTVGIFFVLITVTFFELIGFDDS